MTYHNMMWERLDPDLEARGLTVLEWIRRSGAIKMEIKSCNRLVRSLLDTRGISQSFRWAMDRGRSQGEGLR